MKIKKKEVILCYCPLQVLACKTCIHDISKIVTARGFDLGQLIEDNK